MGVINYVTLKSEIINDPASRGYQAQGGNHDGVVKLLTDSIVSVQIDQTWVTREEVLAQILYSEFWALSSVALQKLDILLGSGRVNIKSLNVRSMFVGNVANGALFAVASATKTNFLTLQTRDGSRMEALFGEGTIVTREDVGKALLS